MKMELAKIKKNINRPILIALAIGVILVFIIFEYVYYLIDKPLNVKLPDRIIYADKVIPLAWTDDNTDENLIIQSDQKTYYGFNSSAVYFSITNLSRREQKVNINLFFPEGRAELKEIARIENNQERELAIKPYNEEENTTWLASSKYQRKEMDGPAAGRQIADTIKPGQSNYYKAKIAYSPMAKGEFFIEAIGDQGGYGQLDPWYSSSWTYRKKITIDADRVMTDAVDFPVLATTTDVDLKDTTSGGHVASSTGGDIVFTDSANNLLNFEQEYYASTTGEIAYWIKTDISSTTDTVLYMYYGNANATYLATTTGVWDSNYKGVWHLGDGDSTAAGFYKDSTSNSNNGQMTDADGDTVQVTGQIGNAMDFNGDADMIDMGDGPKTGITNAITFELWAKAATTTMTGGYAYAQGHNWSGFQGADLRYTSTSKIAFRTGNGIAFDTDTSNGSYTMNMQHITLTYDGAEKRIYINGAIDKVAAYTETISYGASNAFISDLFGSPSVTYIFVGILDEVRVSKTARSDVWIMTEYNNQVDVATFMSFGDEATSDWYNSDWPHRKKITINKDQVYSNEADFPVLATTTDPDLARLAQPYAYDLVFTASDGTTKLPHEIEKFSKDTGELVAWIGTTISSTTDTVLFMYYGNPGIFSPQASSTAVWDSNYKGVWHLGDGDSTAANFYKDSTIYTNHGQLVDADGNTNAASGQIANAIDFSGDGDNIKVIDPGSGWDFSSGGLNPGTSDMTLQMWVSWPTASYYDTLLRKGGGTVTSAGYLFFYNTTDEQIRLTLSDGLGNPRLYLLASLPKADLQDNTFHTVAVTLDRDSVATFYFDGGFVGSADCSSFNGVSLSNNSLNFTISATANPLDAVTDEVRVSSNVRSPEWIKTEFNNQSDVESFLSIGTPEDYPVSSVGWYNSSWAYRKKLTIEADLILANQTDFPVLVNTYDSRLISKARPDGYDILFTSFDGTTLLNFEREQFAASTGQLVYWVKTNISSTTNTILYMYYGNPNQSSDLATTTGVWDSNFKGVWHLNNTWNASSTDSTLNNNNGASTNFYSATSSVAGQVGSAINFDGVDDYVQTTSSELKTAGSFTASVWIKSDSNTMRHIIWQGNSVGNGGGAEEEFAINVGDTTTAASDVIQLFIEGTDNDINITTSFSDTTNWNHVTAVVSGLGSVSASATFYINGSSVGTDTSDAITRSTWDTDLRIGRPGANVRLFAGIIDEVRISNTVRSAEWIDTEYRNQASPENFVFLGAEESYRVEVEGGATKINSSLVNYNTAGLVGYWTFDGADMDWGSNTAHDRSGQGNNGTIINMSTSTSPAIGISGQALEFNGSNDYIDIGNAGSGIKTISFWLKADDITSRKIIDIDGTDQIEIDASNNITATNFPAATVYVDASSASAIVTADWHFVAITDSTGVNAAAMDIGRVSAGYFDGMLDEVRIYSYALPQSKITDLYQVGARRLKTNVNQVSAYTGGLVGQWTFNGVDMDWASGTAYDRSGQGNNGDITNMSTSTSPAIGISGQALEFDGVDDYVNTNLNTHYTQTSISAWFKMNSWGGNALGRIVDKREAGSEVFLVFVNGAWQIGGVYNNSVHLTRSFSTLAGEWHTATSTIASSTWYHVAVTYDESSTENDPSIYIDGVSQTVYEIYKPTGTADTNSDNYLIGNRGALNRGFDGIIDEVRIYNRILSPDEVMDLYNLGARRLKR